MIIRRLLAVGVLVIAGLGVAPAPSAQAAECEGPATGERGKVPLCDMVEGDREFTLTSVTAEECESPDPEPSESPSPSPTETASPSPTETASPSPTETASPTPTEAAGPELCDTAEAGPGGTLYVQASGFVREAGDGGQTLTFKLNDIDIIGSKEAAADGTVKDAAVVLPSVETFCKYRREYGSDSWWIRVLVGSGRLDSKPDLPASSLHQRYEMTVDLSEACKNVPDSASPTPSSTPTTSTTPTTSGTTPTSSGTLPKTGIEDHGVLLATGGLALAALLALVIDRRLRRRRVPESA